MVEKKITKPLGYKMNKIIETPKDIIISPAKFKTRQVDVKEHFRYVDEKVRKHKRTVRCKK